MAGLGIDFSILIAYAINFAVLIVLLRVTAYKPILGMLERRKMEIANNLAAADKVKEEAEQERSKYQAELAEARRSSQEEATKIAQETAAMRDDILAEAHKEAEAIKAKARHEIEIEHQAIQAELQRQMADLTVELTQKVMKQSLDKDAHRQMVEEFLVEIGA